jgi:hypothetical protein
MQNNSEPEEITKLQDLDINEEEIDEEERYIDEDEEDILRKIEELSSQENNTSLDFGTNEHPRVLDILLEAYETFPNLRKLTDLNLTNNWLCGSSLSIELLEFLKLFPELVSLNLDWNDFSSVSKCTGCTKDQILNLKNLSIHGCYINVIHKNSYNIIGFLECFPKLVSLHLGDNGLDDKWMVRFEPVLEQYHDLAELNLNSNEIGPKGAKILANVLQGSNFIRLHLFGNNIGAEGAMYIAQVLAQCPNFVELILNTNNIGDEGALYIANALCNAQCPNLVKLNLRYNNISDEGAKSFEKVLCNAQCSSLTDLNLDHNNISEEAAKRLKEKLSQSHNLVLKELLLEYQSSNPRTLVTNEQKALKKPSYCVLQ